MSEISNWYKGKNILITGLTGFIGKVLTEKFLRNVDGIGTIYVFLRPKKNKTVEERWSEILGQPIFEKILNNNPEKINKVKIINACITGKGINISVSDENELIENCNIIFHCAADVRFDKELHEIIPTNTFGMCFMHQLAAKMKQLQSFVFCSTAFSQYYEIIMEERRYNPPIDLQHMRQILEKVDQHTVNVLTKKILGRHENTYAFSKALAEDVVFDYEGRYPIAIARPSIVTAAVYEPLPGWTEGMNGFNGWVYGVARGVVKSSFGALDVPSCIIPVDIVSNSLIIIGWDIGTRKSQKVEFFNIANRMEEPVTWRQCFKESSDIMSHIMLDYSVLPVGGTIKTNKYHNALDVFIYQLIPTLVMDLLLIICFHKPIMYKVYKKVKNGQSLTLYYVTKKFIFKADNFYNLKKKLNHNDRRLFYTDLSEVYKYGYFYNYFYGVRKYIAKEKDENLPRARLFNTVMQTAGLIVKLGINYCLLQYLWNRRLSFVDFFVGG